MPISACTSSICFLSRISLRMCFSRQVSMSNLISSKELSSLSRFGESFQELSISDSKSTFWLCRLSNKGRFFFLSASNSLSRTAESRSPSAVSSSYVAVKLVKLEVSLEKLF